MNSQDLQHIDCLKKKMSILQNICENSISQANALKREDYSLLGKLLLDRQGYLDNLENLAQTVDYNTDDYGFEKNPEIIKLNQNISFLLNKIITISNTVLEKTSDEKKITANMVLQLQLSQKAVREGYFKKVPQRYGYFIDKVISR
ncbi:MAG TPA: hypothetical protein VN370_08175 [Desulfitobacteriaceae bacterium]|nr:hypothetical protein [Desulfitobacteriaceae bacterium]